VSRLIKEIANLVETTISKKVQLRLELGADLPAIEADVSQVQQVLMNLVINGAEAIGEQRGTVLVTTGVQDIDERYAQSLFAAEVRSGRYVFIEVHDTGVGWTPRPRPRSSIPSSRRSSRAAASASRPCWHRARPWRRHQGVLEPWTWQHVQGLLPGVDAGPARARPARAEVPRRRHRPRRRR